MSRRSAFHGAEIRERFEELVLRSGPWRDYNVHLAPGLFTIGEGLRGGEAGVRRTLQVMRDLFDGSFAGRRVLDLGCGEGGVALEIARQGAEVVGLDAQDGPIEKAAFAAEALGLTRATFVAEAPRGLSPEAHGYFDAVVAAGLLPRLPSGEAIDLVHRIGAVTKGWTLLETRWAAQGRISVEHGVQRYRGSGAEDGIGFLLTRPSFLDLLQSAGFTTIGEIQDAGARPGAATVLAWKGRRVALHTAPQANAIVTPRFSRARPAKGLAAILPRRRS
jgi:SAM-dependent methyltransferase